MGHRVASKAKPADGGCSVPPWLSSSPLSPTPPPSSLLPRPSPQKTVLRPTSFPREEPKYLKQGSLTSFMMPWDCSEASVSAGSQRWVLSQPPNPLSSSLTLCQVQRKEHISFKQTSIQCRLYRFGCRTFVGTSCDKHSRGLSLSRLP